MSSAEILPRCGYSEHQHALTERELKRLNDITEKRDVWTQKYIDRTMPIRSHFLILVSSLSILASFAAVMKYIEGKEMPEEKVMKIVELVMKRMEK